MTIKLEFQYENKLARNKKQKPNNHKDTMNIECARKKKDRDTKKKKHFHFNYKENKERERAHTVISGDINRVKSRRINYAKIILLYIFMCEKKSNVHPYFER
jgi:hypothetical protein